MTAQWSTLTPDEQLLAATLVPGIDAARAVRTLLANPTSFDEPPLGAGLEIWQKALAGDLWRLYERERTALERLNAHWVTPLAERIPSYAPREVLRVQGVLPPPGLAIVGARKADPYGVEIAQRIAQSAVSSGLAVISGGAYGIDIAAHRAALDAGGQTVVVLGAGLDHASPTRHAKMFAEARACGAVVSPFPCGLGAERWTFPRRNPWIAALSIGVVVVQANVKSGSLQTARAALKMGLPVWVVPGPMDNPLHAGCHRLVGEGAQVLSGPAGWRDSSLAELASVSAPVAPQSPDFAVDLWNAAAEAATLVELASRCGLDVAVAASQATLLEIGGWLMAMPGGRLLRRVPTSPSRE